MILLPGHEVDRGRTLRSAAPIEVPGHDLALAAERVASWGGHPAWFRQRLAAALALAPSLAGSDLVSASSVAAWRSGVLGLRDDALAAATALLHDHGPDAVGALVDLPRSSVADLLAAQAVDRFAWPPWRAVPHTYVLARIGGFIGLGGAWRQPPTEVSDVGPGRWLLRTGDERWRLDADLFGHVLAPADSDDVAAARSAGPGRGGRTRLATGPTSYLASIVSDPSGAA